jgi:ferredoxin, 2Fe-2S
MKMGKVTYIEFSGKSHEVQVEAGRSLMEGATSNLVPGIIADCGGACACATCHVYVEPEWERAAGTASEMEAAMLDVVIHRAANSRLSCQIKMSEALDGIVLRLPESQV